MRKFVGMTNKEYLLAGRCVGKTFERRIIVPCKNYRKPDVYCGLPAIGVSAVMEDLHCTACFNKPVKKVNGHYVLREVKENETLV